MSVSSLGILGSGQLAGMLTAAANRLGIDVHIYRPTESDDRCSADHITTGLFDDTEALAAFADSVDAVTIETENIPIATLNFLEARVAVHPSSSVVQICQDRLAEKHFLSKLGVPTATYASVESAAELDDALRSCGGRGILKTRRFGYDGKGQTLIDGLPDSADGWQRHSQVPSILEGVVPFDFEVSVIAARSHSGEMVTYEPGRNEHRNGVLVKTEVPAQLDTDQRTKAIRIAECILEALDYVGVLGVEFFVVGSELVVNEMAPRVHNSGHWTQQGCAVDQFEQHVRAVMRLPLGDTARHCDVTMTNILGDNVALLESGLTSPRQRLHLYGKRDARPGRKMGHINSIQPWGSRP